MSHAPTGDRDQARDELRAAVAVLSGAYQVMTRELSEDAFAGAVAPLVADLFPDPLEVVQPLCFVALRLAGLYAAVSGRTVASVLEQLGAEVSAGPTRPAG